MIRAIYGVSDVKGCRPVVYYESQGDALQVARGFAQRSPEAVEAAELVSRIDYCTDEKRGELPVQRKGETR